MVHACCREFGAALGYTAHQTLGSFSTTPGLGIGKPAEADGKGVTHLGVRQPIQGHETAPKQGEDGQRTNQFATPRREGAKPTKGEIL